MTRRIVSPIALLPLIILACSDGRLTGPEAQEAFVRARSHATKVVDGVIVVLDGKVLASGARIDGLEPQAIRSIEIVKGPAARRLYGDQARRGVIYIYTDSTPQAKD